MTGIVQQFIENQQQLARARGRRFRIKKPPVAQFPGDAERGYRSYLLGLLDAVKRDVDELMLPFIPGLVRAAGGRGDAAGFNLEDVEGTLSTATEDINLRLNNQHLRGLEEKVGEYQTATSRRVTRDLRRQIRSMISLDAFPQAGSAERVQADTYLRQNVKLIQSLTGRYVNQVEDMVRRGVQEGDRAAVIEEKVLGRWKVARSRAKLIARDQIAKLRGNLTRIRQESLGIEKYRWRTSRDERVRASHAAKEGKVYSWDKPPRDTGHPGQDYQCRCTAEPVMEEDEGLPRYITRGAIGVAGTGVGLAATAGAGAAGAATGAAGTAATTAATAALVPAATWPFQGAPWPQSAVTPTEAFSSERLAAAIKSVDVAKGAIPAEAQVAIRRELNALIAEHGLTSSAITRGLPDAGKLGVEDLRAAELLGMYQVHTGKMVADQWAMGAMQREVKRGMPVESDPFFKVLVHETVHSSGARMPLQMKGIRRMLEEVSAEHETQKLMAEKFGTPEALFTHQEGPYWSWAQNTRDAIWEALGEVETGLPWPPYRDVVQTNLTGFLRRFRTIEDLTDNKKLEQFVSEGFFPDKYFPGKSAAQMKTLRRKLMKVWRRLMKEKGMGGL